MSEHLALENLTVLDLTRVLAGPFCTMMLADLGATVIKIEVPNGGDDTRGYPPFRAQNLLGERESLYFANINRNKYGLTLNLKSEAGKEIFRKLAAKADIVVENYRPGVMDRLGLGYDDLKEINPRLIYAAVSGFGCYGPYSKRPGYDILAQAMGGMMAITGPKGGEPTRAGSALGDILGGLHLMIGILSAVNARNITGRGQRVDVSLMDSIIAATENTAIKYLESGVVPTRMGNRYASVSPYDSFRCKDGVIIIACGNQHLYEKMCLEILNRPDMITDPRFLDIDPHLLDGKYLIGLDYSQDRNILVGCAGISIHALTLPAAKVPLADPQRKTAVKITLSGLTGGHGGGDIIHYRANAIRILAELLYALQEETSFDVASIFAGEKNNSIPTYGELVLCYPRENSERVAAFLEQTRTALQGEYAETDPGLSLVWEEAAPVQQCYTAESTAHLMQMMDLLPNGPFNFIDKARKFCKCSSNLGVLKEIDEGFYFTDTVRANSTYQNIQAHRRIAGTAALCGASHECISYLPPWEYQRDSAFAKAVAKIWEPIKGYRPEENIIHATVETGLLIEKMHACGNTEAQGINLGVHNIDVHTFNERMELATLGKTFEVLRAILEQIEA